MVKVLKYLDPRADLTFKKIFGSGDDAEEMEFLDPAFIEGFHRVDGASPGGEHRVDEIDVEVGDVLGEFAEIFHRHMGFFVPVHPDVAHVGPGDEIQHAIHHAKPRAEDGDEAEGIRIDDGLNGLL